METIVISDLHLGDGGDYEIFAGREALIALIDSLDSNNRLFVNGDSVDFLTNDDALDGLVEERAVKRAEAIATSPVTSEVLLAVGRLVQRGGAVTIRIGNHDVELALTAVQAIFQRAARIEEKDVARFEFVLGDEPSLLAIGGARVLITHGEHNDRMNQIAYVRKAGGRARVDPETFCYPPGSRLVKELLNPLKRRHRMRYMDLLKPDFQGAVLAAMATNPAALRVLMKRASIDIVWAYLRNQHQPFAFDENDSDLGLSVRLRDVGLDAAEVQYLEALFAAEDGDLAAFDDDDGTFAAARRKLLQKGLEGYARVHRAAAAGDSFFSLTAGEKELADVKRLSAKYAAQVVVEGHTHAARWFTGDGLVYANTGTWIPLMRLPPPDANDLEWGAFLLELKQNPSLDPARQVVAKLETHFHSVRLSDAACTVSLEESTASGPRVLGVAPLSPS